MTIAARLRLSKDKRGREPEPIELKKPKNQVWFIRFSGTLAVLLTGILVLIAPFAVSLFNGIPDTSDLQTISVRILKIYPTEPHLWVRLPDGRQQGMEWPVPITGGKGGMRAYVLTDEESRRLPGCQATVRGAPLIWTISERFRVWELSCPDKDVQIGTDKTGHEFDVGQRVDLISSLIVIPIWLFFNCFVFLLEKRGRK